MDGQGGCRCGQERDPIVQSKRELRRKIAIARYRSYLKGWNSGTIEQRAIYLDSFKKILYTQGKFSYFKQGNFTLCVLKFRLGKRKIVGYGMSKRNYNDHNDPRLGRELARTRAVDMMANTILRELSNG